MFLIQIMDMRNINTSMYVRRFVQWHTVRQGKKSRLSMAFKLFFFFPHDRRIINQSPPLLLLPFSCGPGHAPSLAQTKKWRCEQAFFSFFFSKDNLVPPSDSNSQIWLNIPRTNTLLPSLAREWELDRKKRQINWSRSGNVSVVTSLGRQKHESIFMVVASVWRVR